MAKSCASLKVPLLFQALRLQRGFTLAELMIAAVISGVISLVAGYGLIHLVSANQTSEEAGRATDDLRRAAAIIADDIREASFYTDSASPPTPWVVSVGVCNPAFYLQTTSSAEIGYYVCPSNSVWEGPYSLYRLTKANPAATPTPTSQETLLIDGIVSASPSCTSNGTPPVTPTIVQGMKIFPEDTRTLKFCLRRNYDGKSEIEVENRVFLRVSS